MVGRELRRLRDEEGSRFACGELLHQRYVLQRLLGKGGFSEVFQVGALSLQAGALFQRRPGARAAGFTHWRCLRMGQFAVSHLPLAGIQRASRHLACPLFSVCLFTAPVPQRYGQYRLSDVSSEAGAKARKHAT